MEDIISKGDDLSWQARKADSLRRKITGRPDLDAEARARRVERLLERLRRGGIHGSVEDRTLYTRRLPPGCRGCLAGKGTNLYATGLCTRECFFCFNEKPRRDELVVHGIKVKEPEEARGIVERFALRSVGISGGDPLMVPDRTLRVIRSLRGMPARVRIDIYTNGDRADEAVLRRLREAGADAIRFNLVANGFDYAPVRRALEIFPEVAVEIPVVPKLLPRLKDMVRALDGMDVPFLNIHELFACRENDAKVSRRGYGAKGAEAPSLLWAPVAEGEEAALELLLYALKNTERLSTYYCSTATQQLISERGLRRRRARGQAGPIWGSTRTSRRAPASLRASRSRRPDTSTWSV